MNLSSYFLVIIACLYVVELVVMAVLQVVVPRHWLTGAILDSTALTICLLPALYYFHYRPLKESNRRHREAELKLQRNLRVLEVQESLRTGYMQGNTVVRLAELLLRQLRTLHWIPFGEISAVYLYDEGQKHCRLMASLGMSGDQRQACAHIGGGNCLCDDAITSGRVVQRTGGSRPDWRFDNEHPHNVFVLPLLDGSKPIGAIVTYLETDQVLDETELSRLQSIGDVFARIVVRYRARTQLQDAEQRFADVASNVGEWIWEVDATGKYVYSSAQVTHLLGYTPEEILSTYFYDHFVPNAREELKRAAMEAFAQHQSFQKFRNLNVRKDGSLVMLETSGVPIVDGSGVLRGYRGSDRDATREYEQELALERALSSADAMEQAKRALLHAISHELRTPLNGIVGALDLLAESRSMEEASEYLPLAKESSTRLERLVDKVIDYVNISDPQMEAGEYTASYQQLRNQLQAQFGNAAEAKSVALRFEFPPEHYLLLPVNARFVSLLLNELLENAIKFSHDGEVVVSVVNGAHHLKLSVSDTGIGIDRREVERLYRDFAQGEVGDRRSHDGLGLGLAIVMEIVKRMGGELRVRQREEVGTTFEIDLPVASAAGFERLVRANTQSR